MQPTRRGFFGLLAQAAAAMKGAELFAKASPAPVVPVPIAPPIPAPMPVEAPLPALRAYGISSIVSCGTMAFYDQRHAFRGYQLQVQCAHCGVGRKSAVGNCPSCGSGQTVMKEVPMSDLGEYTAEFGYDPYRPQSMFRVFGDEDR